MDRTQLQQLADLRVEDAKVLLAGRRWGAAYYLLGYSIECALKACVAKQFRLHEVPDKKFVNSFYTHDLEELLAILGVKSEKEKRARSDKDFENNWNTIAADWNEAVRYESDVTEKEERGLFKAVTDDVSGVLPWLKTQW